MNAAAVHRIHKISRKTQTSRELKMHLIRERNMDFLCHCSGEINESVRRFFSVNHFHVGDGESVLILASAFPPDNLREDVSPLERIYVYSLIDEVLTDTFYGKYSLYTAPIDGRLTAFIPFLQGLSDHEREMVYQSISQDCHVVARLCKDMYDLNVLFYITRIIPSVQLCTPSYERLYSMASLHRFVGLEHLHQIYKNDSIIYPSPRKPGPLIKDDSIENLASVLVTGADPFPLAKKILDEIIAVVTSINSLLGVYRTQFENLITELNLRGMNINTSSLVEQIYEACMRATDWDYLVNFFHSFTDSIYKSRQNPQLAVSLSIVDRACGYIDEHLEDPSLNLNMIASHLGISASSVSSAFLSVKQVTMPVYIRNTRLSVALERIRNTDQPIKDIAAQCGFASIVTFYRVFKQKYGLPPGQIIRAPNPTEAATRSAP